MSLRKNRLIKTYFEVDDDDYDDDRGKFIEFDISASGNYTHRWINNLYGYQFLVTILAETFESIYELLPRNSCFVKKDSQQQR
jgi:hypothetical protein